MNGWIIRSPPFRLGFATQWYVSLTVLSFMLPLTEFPRRSTTSTSKPGYDGRNLVAFQLSTVMSFSAAR